MCNTSQGGFCHLPNRTEYASITPEERDAFWDELYEARGFSLLLSNYRETFLEAGANRDLSNYVARRIRERVNDPELADKLIAQPTAQRVLEVSQEHLEELSPVNAVTLVPKCWKFATIPEESNIPSRVKNVEKWSG